MKYFAYFVLVVFLLAANVGFFSYVRIFGATANLLLVLTLLVSLQKDFRPYMFVAALSGIMLDFYTGVYFGSFSFSFVIAAFFLRLIAERVVVHELNWKYLFSALFFSLLFVDFFVWQYNFIALRASLSGFSLSFQVLQRQFLPGFLYNAILLYPVFF